MMQQAPGAEAIRDTLARVFEAREYRRGVQETLLDRLWAWVGDILGRLFGGARALPGLQEAAILLLGVLLVAVVARFVYVTWQGRVLRAEERGGRGGRRVAGAPGGDPWREAQALAAAGRFTEAAHLLYAAILEALAARERVRLHPSKTVGDYARDLRRRSSALLPGYRDFARQYEAVVYGMTECDAQRYARLQSAAGEIVAGG